MPLSSSSRDPVEMSAVTLAAEIAARRISCRDVMKATLTRVNLVNTKVNAIIALRDPDVLLAEADARDASLARGEPAGALFGFPLAVKDLSAVKGLPLTRGSPILANFVADADAIMVERMRAAGAIFIGKTNVPEFGLGSQTYNTVHGPTLNAYDTRLTAGGSSGGAAVALALRMVPVADGGDVGGSLRNPAGWNNVYGMRPSFGRIPSDAPDPWMPSLHVLGPMARSVADLALLFSVQVGYDPRDPMSLEGDGARFRGPLDADVRGKRIAWAGDFGGALPCEPGVLDLCREALDVFTDLGCVVEEAAPDFPLSEVWRAFTTLRHWQAGASLMELYLDPAKRALLKPEAVFEVEGALKLSGQDIVEASAVRAKWTRAVTRFFETCDFFVLPTAQVFPFDVNLKWPREIAGRTMKTYHEWMQCSAPATLSGCPTLAAPAGFSAAGLPMGIQIIAPNHGELDLLRLGHAYDLATNWATTAPPPMLSVA